MATPNTTPEMGEDEIVTPPARAAKPAPAPVVELPDPAEIQAELERTRAALKKANDESKKHRLAAEEIARKEEEKVNASLGETERITKAHAAEVKRANEAEAKAVKAAEGLQTLRVDVEIERYATGKFKSPTLVPRLVDRNKIQVDEDGSIMGVKAAVDQVLKEYPELATAGAKGGTPPRGDEPPRRQMANQTAPAKATPQPSAGTRPERPTLPVSRRM